MQTHIPTPAMRPAFSVAMRLIEYAAELRGVDPTAITRWDRRNAVVRARWGVMWTLRQLGLSRPRIARHVGLKDHTTVLYGCRMAERLNAKDPDFKDYTDKLLAYALSLEPKVGLSKAA